MLAFVENQPPAELGGGVLEDLTPENLQRMRQSLRPMDPPRHAPSASR